jgi:hypothetical protein
LAFRNHRDNDIDRIIAAAKRPIAIHFQHRFMIGIDNKNWS